MGTLLLLPPVPPLGRLASDEPGLMSAFRDGALPGVVEGGLGTLDTVLERLRLPGVVEGGRNSPAAAEDRPERLDRADCGLADASVGTCVDRGLTF